MRPLACICRYRAGTRSDRPIQRVGRCARRNGLFADKKMEPTDLKSNRSAQLRSGRMALDGSE